MTKTLSFRSSFAMSTLGVAALSIGTTAKAQYAQLLGDINTEPQVSIQSSYPSYGRTTQFVEEQKFINLGGKILFTATTSAGTELFSMNAAGTVAIVKDINAGSASSSPYNLIKVGTKVFFTATTAAEGNEIWVTDGSAAGTTLFAKTVAGSGSLNPYYLAPIMVGTTLNIVFRGRGTGTADKGYELYITDGTTTSLLKDIYPGTTTGGSQNSGYPTYMTANGGMSKVYFYADNGTNGRELWATDGTAAGTALVKDIYSGTGSSYPGYFRPMGASKMLFRCSDGTNGYEAWITDGTAAGTTLLKNIATGTSSGCDLYYSTMIGSKVVFRGYTTGVGATGYEPWITDGTTAGTVLLKDITAGTGSSSFYSMASLGSTAYIALYTGGKYQIWKSTGTAAGTTLWADNLPQYPRYIEPNGTKCFMYGRDTTNGYEPWVTDGTAAGTFMLMDVYNGTGSGYGYYITTITGPFVGMRVYAKLTATADPLGYEMAISGGTTATTKVIDLLPNISGTASDSVQYISDRFGRVIFSANNGTATGKNGQELFVVKSTGKTTHATPTLVKDIYAGTGGSYPSYTCRLGNYVYFGASNGTTAGNNGNELWRTDGTPAGTTLVKDIYAGTSSSYPRYLTRAGKYIFFQANDGTNGYELWRTDGTAAGTVMVKDIYAGSSSSSPNDFEALGSKVLFRAYSTGVGTELWITDGTAAGTTMVKDLYVGSSSTYPQYLQAYKGKVYFYGTTPTTGYELFVSDGTAAGTMLFKDIVSGTSSSYPRYLEVQNGTLYFACNDGTNGYELWKSTGTAASTVMAFQYTSFDLSPYYLTAIGSRKLFMAANVSTYGTEMSFTDTTKAPNLSFWNIHGTGSSSPYNYTNGKYRYAQDSGRVYFRAYSNNVYDYRLWTINSSHTGAPMGVSHVIGDDQGGTAKLSATDCVMGGNMIVKGTTGVANPLNVLMFGVPYEVPYMVPGGFYAYHHPALFWILGNFAGTAFAFNFPIPNDASIAGSQIVLQNWSLNAATFPAGWNLSNGVHCTVGK